MVRSPSTSSPPPSQTPAPDMQPRMPFSRSKNGCLTCRRRKKKCDEFRPRCAPCRRLQVECVWSQDAGRALGGRSQGAAAFMDMTGLVHSGDVASSLELPDEACPNHDSASRGPGSESLPPYEHDPHPMGVSGLPRATSLTPSSVFLFQHYVQVTAPLLASVPAPESPFLHCFLPLAHEDDVLMHALLAVGGIHLAYQQQHAQGSSAIVAATWRHYSIVVSSLRAEFAQLNMSDAAQLLRLLHILIILCHHEAMGGNKVANTFFKHLRAVRQLILTLLHHPQQSARNSAAFGFCLELYAYFVLSNVVTPHGAIEERTLPFDGFLASSSDTLSAYATFGIMFVGAYDLFETIPRISVLAERRLALEASPLDLKDTMAELQSEYHALQHQIISWVPLPRDTHRVPPLPPSEWEERRLVSEIHRQAVLIYLETALAGSVVSDPATMTRIQGHVLEGSRMLEELPVAQSAALLFWSLVVLGSCAVTPVHRAQMADLLGNSRYQMRHIHTAYCMLQKLWEDEDPRAFGPFGLSRAMQENGWCFACL